MTGDLRSCSNAHCTRIATDNGLCELHHRQGPPAPLTAPCGTNRAYKQHLRRGQVADQACLDAHAAYRRDWSLQQQGIEEWDGNSDEPHGYTALAVCQAAHVTYRQLDYWARTDLVPASIRSASGSGTVRLYSRDDAARAAIIRVLLTAGLTLPAVRQHLEPLTRDGYLQQNTTDGWPLLRITFDLNAIYRDIDTRLASDTFTAPDLRLVEAG